MSATFLPAADHDWSRPAGQARLLLMRHAKSDYPVGVIDHDRPLNSRGQADAAAAAAWLAEQGTALLGDRPLVLVSSARRTQQTWQLAGAELGLQAMYEPRLFQASDHTYLQILRDGLALADTVLVIGHNPATESAARLLAANDSSSAYRAMLDKFPTSAIAVIDLPDASLTPGSGTLNAYVVPRGPRPTSR